MKNKNKVFTVLENTEDGFLSVKNHYAVYNLEQEEFATPLCDTPEEALGDLRSKVDFVEPGQYALLKVGVVFAIEPAMVVYGLGDEIKYIPLVEEIRIK